MDTRNLAELYERPPIEWTYARESLDSGFPQGPGSGGPDRHTTWLTTINPDGTPHVTAVGALWHDGRFWFQAGQSSRKGRNVARDPRCAMSVSFQSMDFVANGVARLITDPAVVAEIAGLWAAGGWPAKVDDSGVALTAPYNAQSAGPPPWHVYAIDVNSAHAVQTEEPYGATRWQF
ncbi:pyridoxamine 5'-phosphate oxidase family protein [Amycolatopsis acidicola]|uniref:Pyridoxamine 5'-phosphate oxidase family protein n=1 Tax=Amycolatopsis acidicola TaxID=2596893 RepID=A0A5N0UMS0_9PSEU|nr:pyridoxamine 5'-phosphate oxidase family protein [Amycolatopsis acidicola]KAA9151242.1 pyridoxamine 5'-phosphate oxidase family protein [Amycolatopsis acidicola]